MNFNQELKAKASRGKALSYLIDEARGKCGPLFLCAESPDLRRIKKGSPLRLPYLIGLTIGPGREKLSLNLNQ